MCFGYGKSLVPVDVNVKRVIERIFDLKINNIRKLDEETEELLKFIASFAKIARSFLGD